MLKRFLSGLTAITMLLSVGNMTVFADDTAKDDFSFDDSYHEVDDVSYLEKLPSNDVMKIIWRSEDFGQIQGFHKLLNAQDNISAYCIDSENGYIIYDDSSVLEFSLDSQSPYTDMEECYYFGPLNYYVKENNSFIGIRYSEKLDLDLAIKSSNTYESIKSEWDYLANEAMKSLPDVDLIRSYDIINSKQLSYPLSTIAYNNDGSNSCGSLALTIMMYYLHKHKTGYTLKSYYSSYLYQLYLYLRSNIEPAGNGTNEVTLANGYNTYSGNVLLSGSTHLYCDPPPISWGFVYSHIAINKPGVIGITNHPIYGEHWAVTSGVYQIDAGGGHHVNYYKINDGWGNNNINLPASYTDYYLYI